MTDRDKPEKEKVVLDTSIWIAAALTPHGAGEAAIQKALEQYTLIGSKKTLEELERKLIHEPAKRLVEKDVPLTTRMAVLERAKSVTDLVDVRDERSYTRDPNDDMFLQLALDGGARMIVAYDRDITVLDRTLNIQTYKAGPFLKYERELDLRRAPFLQESQPVRRTETLVEQWRRERAEKLKNQPELVQSPDKTQDHDDHQMRHEHRLR